MRVVSSCRHDYRPQNFQSGSYKMKSVQTVSKVAFTVCFLASPLYANPSDSCLDLLGGQRLTIAVPNSAGGGYDTYARALAPVLETHSGASVRVVNMPSGGGLAARSFVMNSESDMLSVLIENTTDLATAPMGTVGRGEQAGKERMIDGYEIVGMVHDEPSAWIGRTDLDLLSPDLETLVAAEGSLDEALLPFLVVSRALGINVDVVTGYDGTSEMTAAILRNESDIASMSLSTALRRAKDEGIHIAMVLTDGPLPAAPELPYLAGEGSVVWALTEDLPPEQAAYQRSLAQGVAQLRGAARGMFVSTNLSEDRRACVAELMDIAIADPAFSEAAEAQGRAVSSKTADESRAFVTALVAAHAQLLPTLQEISAEAFQN